MPELAGSSAELERQNGAHVAQAPGSPSLVDLGLEQLSRESDRLGSLASLAMAEAKLSVLGAGLLLGGAFSVAVLALVAWGLLMVGLALLIMQATEMTLAPTLAVLALAHVLAAVIVAVIMRRIGRSIGFPELRRQLGASR